MHKYKNDYLSIYLLSVLLISLGYLRIFNDNIKNHALIYFGIISILWGISAQYRKSQDSQSKTKAFVNIPYQIKCFFGERLCEDGDINIWVLIHVIIYLIAGILFPGRYLFFFVISILCEWFEISVTTYNSKWFIDPIFNMAGYFMGNLVRKQIGNNLKFF